MKTENLLKSLAILMVFMVSATVVLANQNVSLVGSFKTPNANGVFALGNYAYLTDGDDGLYVVNISNPSNPWKAGLCDVPGWANKAYVAGNYAYVADSDYSSNYKNSGLRIIDISNPANPTQTGFYNTPDIAYGTYVLGEYAYVAAKTGGVHVVDVSNPANPNKASTIAMTEALDVYASGNYVYAALHSAGLGIANISNPLSPYVLSKSDTSGYAIGVFILGNYAYIADFSGLRILDISNQVYPTAVGFFDTPGEAYEVYVSGKYAYVADRQSGLRVIDISNPANPTEYGFYDTSGEAVDVCVSGEYIYVADRSGGLVILSLSEEPPCSKSFVIPEVTTASGQDVTVPINITDASGVAGADIQVTYDPSILTIKEVKTTGLTNSFNITLNLNTSGLIIMAMAGANAISAGSANGPAFVDMVFAVKSGLSPGTETPVNFRSADIYNIEGQNISVCTQNGKVKIILGCLKGDVNADGKINSGDAILVLRIAAFLLTPTAQQKCAADMNDDGKVTSADAILILRKASGLIAPARESVASISNTLTITLEDVYGKAGDIITVPVKTNNSDILAGGDICLTYNNSVLRIIELSSDSGAMLVNNVNEPGVIRIAFASDDRLSSGDLISIKFKVLADDMSPLVFKSLNLYDFNALPLDSRGINSKFASYFSRPKYNALMQNFPNPFNPETWMPYQLSEDSEVTIKIFNSQGMLIHELNLGRKPAGLYLNQSRAAYWDGKDRYGENVASGVYFYSIYAGNYTAMRKMIILR